MSGFDHPTFDVRRKQTDTLGRLLLIHDLEFGLQVVLVNDLNLHGFLVAQEALVVLKEVCRHHAHFGNQALCFDWHGKHVLPHARQVYNEHHVVDLREAWDELNLDFGSLVSRQSILLVCESEFLVQGATITRHANGVVYVDFGGVGQIDGFGHRELVADLSEVNNVVRELKSRCYHVTLEGECQHLRRALQSKAESFGELSKDIR